MAAQSPAIEQLYVVDEISLKLRIGAELLQAERQFLAEVLKGTEAKLLEECLADAVEGGVSNV